MIPPRNRLQSTPARAADRLDTGWHQIDTCCAPRRPRGEQLNRSRASEAGAPHHPQVLPPELPARETESLAGASRKVFHLLLRLGNFVLRRLVRNLRQNGMVDGVSADFKGGAQPPDFMVGHDRPRVLHGNIKRSGQTVFCEQLRNALVRRMPIVPARCHQPRCARGEFPELLGSRSQLLLL
jgi:hypothetical protein